MTIRLVVFACSVVAINSCAGTTGAFDIQESTQTDMRTAPNSRHLRGAIVFLRRHPCGSQRSQASAVPWPEVFKNLNAVGAKYGVEIRSDVAVGNRTGRPHCGAHPPKRTDSTECCTMRALPRSTAR